MVECGGLGNLNCSVRWRPSSSSFADSLAVRGHLFAHVRLCVLRSGRLEVHVQAIRQSGGEAA